MSALSARLKSWLNGTGYTPGHPITDDEDRSALLLGDLLDIVATLADADEAGKGSDLIGVRDTGSSFTGTTLTEVLAELYTAATSASSDSFVDTNAFYATDTVGAAFDAIGVAIGGTNSTTRNYTGGAGTRLIDNDSVFTALNKLDLGFVDLLSVANAKGASLIGVEDAGGLTTNTNVEAYLAEIMGELNDYRDQLIQVSLAVTGGAGGSADGTLETTVTRAITGAVSTACQILIVATPAQYDPVLAVVGTVTFDTPTKGTIAATGAGWALVTTDAAGEFDCAVHDSADETIYFRALTPHGGDAAGERASVVFSNSDAATWAA